LGETVKDFFEDLQDNYFLEPATIIRSGELISFQKEPVKGFQYNRIITKSVMSQTTDIVLLELKPDASRKQFISTEAFECKYVLKGSVEYQVENTKYNLSAGDTIFFNGRLKHRLRNTASTVTQMLVIYFF
jgi:quercetin dioxygenase-like cupin family protein